jgi:type IV pilus assembly protein PilA
MSWFYKMMKKDSKGFTLVELMVVLLILGILVAIAVPIYNRSVGEANKKAIASNLRTIDGAIMQYSTVVDVATTPPTKDTLDGDYIQVWPTNPKGSVYSVVGEGTAASPYHAQVVTTGVTGVVNGTYTLENIVDW